MQQESRTNQVEDYEKDDFLTMLRLACPDLWQGARFPNFFGGPTNSGNLFVNMASKSSAKHPGPDAYEAKAAFSMSS